jgi:electron transfer flavoprotein beta subunit
MVLLQDPMFENLDSFGTAQVLAAAIKKIGKFDLILGGRQASDWDNAQVPLGLAEILGLPCITMAKKVDATDSKVTVERVIPDGHEVVEANLPSLVIVSNELGQPRFPTITNTMAAVRKAPTVWTAQDLEFSIAGPQVRIIDIFVPNIEKECEFIEGENEEDVGRKLALTLREAKLI